MDHELSQKLLLPPDVEQADDENAELFRQALALMPTAEQLMSMVKTKPAPANWFDEDFNRPTS